MILKKCDADHFTKCGFFSSIFAPLKKTGDSRQKLKMLKANNSTPTFNRAFFVRSLRTPKENALSVLLSMVERKGQPLAVGCFPLTAVSDPFMLYRQTVRSLAKSLYKQQLKETAKMLYKFMLLGKNRLKIAIRATSAEQARQQLNLNKNQAVFIARINTRGSYA